MTPLFLANWKMHKTRAEARAFVEEFRSLLGAETFSSARVGIAPPFSCLETGSALLEGTDVLVGAQNVHWEEQGAHTGEISVGMRITDQDLRPGGTISGPTMFALADVTAYLLILAHIGEVALAVTTSLTINFLSKPEPGDLVANGRLIKLGKRLAVCEIHIESEAGGQMVAQATATYSIPPRG